VIRRSVKIASGNPRLPDTTPSKPDRTSRAPRPRAAAPKVDEFARSSPKNAFTAPVPGKTRSFLDAARPTHDRRATPGAGAASASDASRAGYGRSTRPATRVADGPPTGAAGKSPRHGQRANDGDGIVSALGSGASLLGFHAGLHAAGGEAAITAGTFATGAGAATVAGYFATGLGAGLVVGTAINSTGVFAAALDYAMGKRVISNDLPGGVKDDPSEGSNTSTDGADGGVTPSEATGGAEIKPSSGSLNGHGEAKSTTAHQVWATHGEPSADGTTEGGVARDRRNVGGDDGDVSSRRSKRVKHGRSSHAARHAARVKIAP